MLGLGLFFSFAKAPDRSERARITHDALAQAKAALIGYAATYRDVHPDKSFGYLPCPDTNNDGNAEASCGTTDVSMIGRLPWKTLGLPPLHDANGECLWYAVSGHAKNAPETASYNWDTLGQFIIRDKDNNLLAGATPHERPFAIIFSAGAAIGGQARVAGTPECGGDTATGKYLEDVPFNAATPEILQADADGNTTILLASAASIANGTNNDSATWITGSEIFGAVKKRTDFKSAVEALLSDVATCLNNFTPATLASPALQPSGSKGTDNLVSFMTTAANNCSTYATASSAKRRFLDNWKNNLLYARMSASDITDPLRGFSAGVGSGCKAVVVFGGERTGTQQRYDGTTVATLSNYLEGMLATFPPTFLVPNAALLGGAGSFSASNPANDVAVCITGLPAGATQTSFATDFASFGAKGDSGAVSPNAATQTLTLLDASGSTGGCFWYDTTSIPLAGKVLRGYYRFQFAAGDDPAATPDLRYGFTLQMLRSDSGPPDDCGPEADSGVLGLTSKWGGRSFIIETDIYQQGSNHDPAGNHTAILKNGSLDHAPLPAAAARQACNDTQAICEHVPQNRFEELPSPLIHNQRIEITTGCNSLCTICTPSAHDGVNTYAHISVWSDCTGCNDVTNALDRIAQPPTVRLCTALDVSMNRFYVGFTGGFSSTYPNRVTIGDFVLRTE